MQKSTTLATLRSLRIAGSGRISPWWFSRRRFLPYVLWLLGGLQFVGSPAQAGLAAADILVLDQGAGAQFRPLFVVHPTTGKRRVLTDFGNPAQGPLGSAPSSVAVGATRPIYVTALFAGTSSAGALFAVDRD